jgi:hypothetical protein
VLNKEALFKFIEDSEPIIDEDDDDETTVGDCDDKAILLLCIFEDDILLTISLLLSLLVILSELIPSLLTLIICVELSSESIIANINEDEEGG